MKSNQAGCSSSSSPSSNKMGTGIPQAIPLRSSPRRLQTPSPTMASFFPPSSPSKIAQSHYAIIDERQRQQRQEHQGIVVPPSRIKPQIQMAHVINVHSHSHSQQHFTTARRNFLISVQNRPLPPLPPPRTNSHLSPLKQPQQKNQIEHQSHHESTSDICSRSDQETSSVSSIYELIPSPRKCVTSSVIVRTTSKLQFHQHHQSQLQPPQKQQQPHNNNGEKRSVIPPPTFTMAELATKFLEENVRNCIKPRIFPMESASPSPFNERASTPYIFTTAGLGGGTRIHHHQNRRLIFAPSLVMDGFLASKTALVSKTRALASSLGTYSQQNPQLGNGTRMSNSSATPTGNNSNNTVTGSPSSMLASSTDNGSPAKKMENPNKNGVRSDFSSILRKWSAPIPPSLSRKLGRTPESPLGKVKVMLRVCDNPDEQVSGSGILGLDKRRKQVTLVDPGGATPSGITPEERRVGISAPKMFAFDMIFGEDDDQAEICAASAAELVASVVGGEDGCLVSLGYCGAGKKQTMFGKPVNQLLGAVPTAISWLFKSIQEQKQKTGSRFSVRVSAVEVGGGSGHEVINDLLLPFVNDGDDPPGALLENASGMSTTNSRSISAPVLNSVSEVRAPNPETAGFFLDSALDSMNGREEPVGHFVFTLHVYQYSVDKNGKGVAGGRSRLHCVMLGNGSPSISVLGGLVLAVLNGHRHLPSQSNHSKLGAILRECLGSLTCRAVVMIHVSNAHARYAETLAALQLGSRVHRLRRSRRLKMGSVGSGTGSGGSSGGSGEETRNIIGVTNQVGGEVETGSSDIDPSSSEQSCDTVIYLGPSIDEATDGEHPPVYLPSLETTPGETQAKIIPSKFPILNGLNGIPPKTKSPKPKSSKITSDNNFATPNGKSEEQWVDGPNLPSKYRQLNGNHSSAGGANNVIHASQSPAKKKGETWIDGPAARVQHQASNFPSPKRTLTSIQQQRAASASSRNGVTTTQNNGKVNGQSPQGRGSCEIANCPSVCISATKAEMIQKWISNQAPSSTDLFDESPTHRTPMDIYFERLQDNSLQNGTQNGSNFSELVGNNGHLFQQELSNGMMQSTAPVSMNSCPHLEYNNISCHCLNRENGSIQLSTEPEYKALTVFKTCEDDDISADQIHPACTAYDFEFIEVTEPEVPVPTRDVCIQVTEGDIALSFLMENPLPESDQDLEMLPESYFLRPRSNSFSEISVCNTNNSLSRFENENNHPLRVLSQECLTVVSTFPDSASVGGDDMERFWPRLTFPTDQEIHQDMGICHGLYAPLSDISGHTAPATSNHTLSSRLEHMSTQNNKPPTRLLLRELPVLSDDSIYKVPSPPAPVSVQQRKSSKLPRVSAFQARKYRSGKESSDTEGELMKIPPMDIIDTSPITQSCNLPVVNTTNQVQPISVALPNYQTLPSSGKPCEMNMTSPPLLSICDHNHSKDGSGNGHGIHLNGSGDSSNSVQSSPSRSTLTPPSSPSPLKLSEVTKSPSKSKSRRFSRFFRGRSKSPQTAGATSSSESGKSSFGSDAKHSSSSSSCSSGASAPLVPCSPKQSKNHASPKHMSPKQSPSKKQSSRKTSYFSTSAVDCHFTCDSKLPMFVPSPTQKKIVGSADLY